VGLIGCIVVDIGFPSGLFDISLQFFKLVFPMDGDVLVRKQIAGSSNLMVDQIAFGRQTIRSLNTSASCVGSEGHLLGGCLIYGSCSGFHLEVNIVEAYRTSFGLYLIGNGGIILIHKNKR